MFTLWSQQEFDAALINIGKLSAIQLRMRLSYFNLIGIIFVVCTVLLLRDNIHKYFCVL